MQENSTVKMQPQLVDWVGAARLGSQRAYADLYRRFAPLVHSILLGRCRRALAEELTQESFSIAFSRLHQLKEPEKFGAWIATIARRIKVVEPIEIGADALAELPSKLATPEQNLDVEKVLQALMTLPEAYRETMILRLVEGLSGPEISDLTGLTHDSVRVNLHRGMEKLRERLAIATPPKPKHNGA